MVQEDEKVIELVRCHGAKRWSVIASHLKGRIGKQCRERCDPVCVCVCVCVCVVW
jgi:hypothetical protein